MNKPRVVAFATRKGGAGKTTLALAFAALVAADRRKTLFVDLDQEGHASFGIGGDITKPGSAQLLLGNQVNPQQVADNLDLLAGNQELEDPAVVRLEPETLADVLAPLSYEMVVIDCPPNTHQLQKLGVVAAQSVLIPIDAHPYAINCASRLIEDLQLRRNRQRAGASRWAIVANRIDQRRRLDCEVLQDASKLFAGVPLFQVSQDTALSNSSVDRVPVTAYKPRYKGLSEIRTILRWVDET
jgi:chromosome partitioning protein